MTVTFQLSGRFFSLLLFLFLTSSLFAQISKINISGVITDYKTGEALPGANILLYRDSLKQSEIVRGEATNKYGFYSFPSIPTGEYYIFASSIGYETTYKRIFLSDKTASVRVDIQLIEKPYTLEEVVVEDRRETDFSRTTSTIEVTPKLVEKLPSLGGETDIFRALQLLPGVTAATEISTGIYVRGGSPDQNLTLIDGVVVYNPSHLGGFSSTFNSDVLRNIKLIKGGFPAEYGGRLSSILDITMREGTKEKFKGSANINSISSRVTIEGPFDTSSTFIFSGRTMYLDKILPISDEFNSIPRYDFFDFNGKVNYTLSEKDKVFISGFYSKDNINEAPNSVDVGFDINWKNATVNLTWTNFTSSTSFSNTSLMYTNYFFSTLIKDKMPVQQPLDFFTSSEIHDFLLRREMQFFLSDDHTLKGGGEVVYHNFSTTTSDFFIEELRYKPFFGTDINGVEVSFYLQDEWTVTTDLRSNFGGRFYYFKNGDLLTVEPRASITYYILDRLVLRGAFALANQALHLISRNDVYLPTDVWYPSSTKIKPSRSIQGAVGFEVTSVDRSFLFSVEGYYKDLKNLYEYIDNPDFSFGTNIEDNLTKGRGEAYGFEFFLSKRIGNFNGWVGYTLAWTKRYFDDLNRGQFFYPRYDRRHDVSIVLGFDVSSSLNFGATWTYGTGQAFFLPISQYQIVGFNNPQNNSSAVYFENSGRDAFRLPPFHKLDLSCRYKIFISDKALEINFNIYNVYNRFNVFSKYIGYKTDETTGERIPILKQFTLFPFLPTVGVTFEF
ncbi:MAG: hypothetical protein A2V93_01325 [Ignavibacteria bacterium RBG_16_34_14]|nr:MAG: hypothetical protein A2V93_01325 [Ignavibacteria bacterium RBG_16_34_14]